VCWRCRGVELAVAAADGTTSAIAEANARTGARIMMTSELDC
jgi:hypothetical protein